jgi:hypothetical protein
MTIGQIFQLRLDFWGDQYNEAPNGAEKRKKKVQILISAYNKQQKQFNFKIDLLNGSFLSVYEASYLVALGRHRNMQSNQVTKTWQTIKDTITNEAIDDSKSDMICSEIALKEGVLYKLGTRMRVSVDSLHLPLSFHSSSVNPRLINGELFVTQTFCNTAVDVNRDIYCSWSELQPCNFYMHREPAIDILLFNQEPLYLDALSEQKKYTEKVSEIVEFEDILSTHDEGNDRKVLII